MKKAGFLIAIIVSLFLVSCLSEQLPQEEGFGGKTIAGEALRGGINLYPVASCEKTAGKLTFTKSNKNYGPYSDRCWKDKLIEYSCQKSGSKRAGTTYTIGRQLVNCEKGCEGSVCLKDNDINDDINNDLDIDNVLNKDDNCPEVFNPIQEDDDYDGIGNICDLDMDGDNVSNENDNCLDIFNPSQKDTNQDGFGDACEPDIDGDNVHNEDDNCPDVYNPLQEDINYNGIGEACDYDIDGDNVHNEDDNCPDVYNPLQEDIDYNGIGEACDYDIDGDNVHNEDDNCPDVYNPLQEDIDYDGIGDVCGGCLNDECQNKQLDLIIITRPMFVGSLNKFVNWKKEEDSFDVGIYTLEYISQNYEGDNLALQIKTMIHSTKKKNGAMYFLLIGDTEVQKVTTLIEGEYFTYTTYEKLEGSYTLDKPWNIPTLGYNRFIEEQLEYTPYKPTYKKEPLYGFEPSEIVISDLPYTSEDNWKDNKEIFFWNNARYYLLYQPNVYVGRWPLRTTGQLQNIISKTMAAPKIKQFNILASDELVVTWEKCVQEGICDSIPPEAQSDQPYTSHPYCEEFPVAKHMPNPCYSFLHARWLLLKEFPQQFNLVNSESVKEGQYAKEQILNTPPDAMLYEDFHGLIFQIVLNHPPRPQVSTRLSVDDFTSFKNIFPLAFLRSCYVMAFYRHTDKETFGEALLTAEKGPAVVLEIDNSYNLIKNILAGKTIGESFYSAMSTKESIYFTNPNLLFGDPSLVLYGK